MAVRVARGLFRLWLVLSVQWVAGIGATSLIFDEAVSAYVRLDLCSIPASRQRKLMNVLSGGDGAEYWRAVAGIGTAHRCPCDRMSVDLGVSRLSTRRGRFLGPRRGQPTSGLTQAMRVSGPVLGAYTDLTTTVLVVSERADQCADRSKPSMSGLPRKDRPQPSNGLFPRHRWAFPIGNFIQHRRQSIGKGR